jgi:hypothetical protein
MPNPNPRVMHKNFGRAYSKPESCMIRMKITKSKVGSKNKM